MSRWNRSRDIDASGSLTNIPDETEIRITNDHNGKYILKHEELTSKRIEFDEAGAEYWLTFKEVRYIKSTYSKDFQRLRLIITGVRNGEKEVEYTTEAGKKMKKKSPVEIKDVVEALGLTPYYAAQKSKIKTDFDAPDAYDIKEFIMESTVEEFTQSMKDIRGALLIRVADVSMSLYAHRIFNHKVKMDVIEEALDAVIFESIDLLPEAARQAGATSW